MSWVRAAVDEEPLRAFVERFETGAGMDAVRELLARSDDAESALHGLFGVGHEGWYAMAADAISGDCLAVAPGFGRRVGILGGLADTVYALEDDPLALRAIRARARECDAVPVRGDTDDPPFAPDAFDTIVARAPRESIAERRRRAERFAELLTEDGSLVLEFDGPVRASGLASVLGFDDRPSTDPRRSPADVTGSSYRRTVGAFAAAGFESVETFAVLPTGDWFEWAVPVGDDAAIEWLLETQAPSSRTGRLVHGGAALANRIGLLKRCYPTYVAVCSPDPDADRHLRPGRVLRRGANRSIVLDLADGEVDRVRKLPNHPRHGAFNERAATVLEGLGESNPPLAETVPAVSLEDSPLGPALVDRPMEGTPIGRTVDPGELRADPATFDRVLATGLEWLSRLQRDGDWIRTRTPSQAAADLSLCEFGFAPSPPASPVRFRSVPQHGDYHPGNLVVDERGDVTTVIDWEYASPAGSPVGDPAFFALKLAERAHSDFAAGVRRVFVEPTAHATVSYRRLAAFCSRADLDAETFAHYAGETWVNQVAAHVEGETPYRLHTTPRDNVAKLETLYGHRERIRDRLERHLQEERSAVLAARD